jgi:hypothetical protein
MITRHMRMLLAGIAVASAALFSVSAAGTAAAATVHAPAGHSAARAPVAISAAGKIQCGGDICIQNLGCDSVGICVIHAWANTYGFRGHFELQFGCSIGGCVSDNSINTYWHAGGSGWDFGGIPADLGIGAYAWEGGPPWKQIGSVDFSTF